MDIYHIWCDLKPGIRDLDFVAELHAYLEQLKGNRQLHAYRVTRCKLGLRPEQLRDFHIMLEFENLAQMQTAFDDVASRTEPVEGLHHAVNSKVTNLLFALYRDFPDEVRVQGEERF